MSRSRPKILRDSGNVLVGSVGAQALAVARGLVIPILVTPVQYGLWRIVLLAWQYGLYLHAGSFALLNRELPGLRALDKLDEARRMRETAFWGTMAVSTMACLGLVAWSMRPSLHAAPETAWSIRITGLGLIAQQIWLYQGYLFRVRQQFGRLAVATFANAALALVGMAALAPTWGVAGLAGGMFASMIVVALACTRWAGTEPLALRPRVFARMAAEGFPLTVLPLMTTAIRSAGPIVAAAVLGLEATGFIGIGLMFGTIVFAVPKTLATVLYPRYLTRYAKTGKASDLGRPLRISIGLTAKVTPLVAGGAVVALEPLFRLVFPKYLPALMATYLLLVMMPFLAFSVVAQPLLLTLRRHWTLLVIMVIALVLTVAAAWAGALIEPTAAGVASGVCLVNSLFGIAVLSFSLAWTSDGERAIWPEVLGYLLPSVVAAVIIGGMMFIPTSEPNSTMYFLITGGRLLLVSAVGLWVLLRVWRQAKADASELE